MRILILAAVLLSVGLGQTADELTAMERFASQARVTVQGSETLVSGDTKATFATVVLRNGNRQMRGLRIDLASGDVQDRVYVEERFLRALIESLTGLGNSTRFGCTGSCTFLDALRAGAHFVFASQCGSDLVVSTGAARFRFTDTTASRIRDAVRSLH